MPAMSLATSGEVLVLDSTITASYPRFAKSFGSVNPSRPIVIDGSPTLLTAQYNAFETGVKTVTNLALSGIALGTVVSIDIQTADGFNFATLDVSVTFSTLGGQ